MVGSFRLSRKLQIAEACMHIFKFQEGTLAGSMKTSASSCLMEVEFIYVSTVLKIMLNISSLATD
jgi:hypothetical protein